MAGEPGAGPHFPSVGDASELETAFVHELMVAVAEQQQVVEVGWATVGPVVDMVCIAAVRCSSTTWPSASVVANYQGMPLRLGDGSSFPAEVERLAGSTEHDRHHPCVAGEAPDRAG